MRGPGTLSSAPKRPLHTSNLQVPGKAVYSSSQSSEIAWFHDSIFKPVEWECFCVPCSHRWWWEDSQEYTACSKSPSHYVSSPFISQPSSDDVILQSQKDKWSMAAQHRHTCVWRTWETRVLPITHTWGSGRAQDAALRGPGLPSTRSGGAGAGRAGGPVWTMKSHMLSLSSRCSKNTLHWQVICQGNLSETKPRSADQHFPTLVSFWALLRPRLPPTGSLPNWPTPPSPGQTPAPSPDPTWSF